MPRKMSSKTTDKNKSKTVKKKSSIIGYIDQSEDHPVKKSTKKHKSLAKDDSDQSDDEPTDKKQKHQPDNKLLDVKTSQTGAIKQTIERISNVISDCCIVFLPSDSGSNVDDDNYEDMDENNKKSKNKKSKDGSEKNNETKNVGGIRIHRLTEDKSILIKLSLDAANFDYFYCEEPKLTIGVDMHNLHAALKTVSDDNPIMLYMNRDNRNSLFLRSLNENKEGSEQTDIEIYLMDITNPDLTIPKIEFPNKIVMKSEKFHTTCKQLNNNSTFVELRSVGPEISFTGQSEGAKISKSYRDVDYRKNKKKKSKNIIQGMYELRNLMSFSKCNKLCEIIEIYLKNDYPLVLVIAIANLGKMYVFLSPIEDPNK